MGKQKVYIRKKIRKTPYVLFYIFLLIAMLSIFTVASYTWFTLSLSPRVSNMNVYITSGAGLELAASPGAEIWTNQLDIYSTQELSKFQEKDAKKPELRQATWSDMDQCFYGPLYGYDGRLISFTDPHYSMLDAVSWYRLEDQIHANSTTASNYYMKATLYARCGMPTDVSLAEPNWLDEQQTVKGSGTYVIGEPNTGRGPETAVRVGFRITYVDASGDELSETSPMYIYEPNADRHVDGSTDYIPTYSIDEFRTTETTQDQDWFLVDEDLLIRQAFSKSSEEPGKFLSNTPLFSLKPGDIARIELYIWLEGQDVDCSNAMSDGESVTKIKANIQFSGTTETQSGMKPIE